MAMVVQHNIAAQLALGELNKNNDRLKKSLEKVSSGQKINSAKDNASAYSISEKMREQIRTLNQDNQNVQNGSSLFKIADGGINSIVEELRNLKELAINAANDTNNDIDRATIQKDFNQKMANINDIATETNYNGKTLLDGTYGKKVVRSITLGEEEEGESGAELFDSLKGGTKVDAIFVVDTTGSMGGFIRGVASHFKSFADKMNSAGIDWKIGIVRYDDINTVGTGTDIGVASIDFSSGKFTDDEDEIVDALNNLVATLGYGGDADESGYEGVMEALDYSFRPGTERHIFAFTDANVHDTDDADSSLATYSSGDVLNALKAKDVTLSTISPGHLGDWIDMVNETGGKDYSIAKYGGYGPTTPTVITEEHVFNPLKIHHGPKANQHTNFYINDMHTKSLGTGLLLNSGGIPANENDIVRYNALSYDENLQSDWLGTLKAAQNKTLDDISVTTQKNANVAIRVIDGAIEYALDVATQVGSYLQRLEYTGANVTTMGENVQSAESTIRDADMAKEMTDYTKNNVLLQASQSMLAQANQNGSAVLSLLQ